MKCSQQYVRYHAAQHHECALREIHDAARVINDAEPYSDQAVDAPDAKPVDQDLDEIGLVTHATSPLRRDRPRSRADRSESPLAFLQRSFVQNSERRFCRQYS